MSTRHDKSSVSNLQNKIFWEPDVPSKKLYFSELRSKCQELLWVGHTKLSLVCAASMASQVTKSSFNGMNIEQVNKMFIPTRIFKEHYISKCIQMAHLQVLKTRSHNSVLFYYTLEESKANFFHFGSYFSELSDDCHQERKNIG